MPITQRHVVCINHPEEILAINSASVILPVVENRPEGQAISDTAGIPLHLMTCQKCGYVELYREGKLPLADIHGGPLR